MSIWNGFARHFPVRARLLRLSLRRNLPHPKRKRQKQQLPLPVREMQRLRNLLHPAQAPGPYRVDRPGLKHRLHKRQIVRLWEPARQDLLKAAPVRCNPMPKDPMLRLNPEESVRQLRAFQTVVVRRKLNVRWVKGKLRDLPDPRRGVNVLRCKAVNARQCKGRERLVPADLLWDIVRGDRPVDRGPIPKWAIRLRTMAATTIIRVNATGLTTMLPGAVSKAVDLAVISVKTVTGGILTLDVVPRLPSKTAP